MKKTMYEGSFGDLYDLHEVEKEYCDYARECRQYGEYPVSFEKFVRETFEEVEVEEEE